MKIMKIEKQKQLFRMFECLCGESKKIRIKSFPFSALFTVVLLYAAMQSVGITCPIKYLTGVSCAGCGMTRAYLSFLCLNLSEAIYYHPLFFLPPIFLLVYIRREKIGENIYHTVLFLMVFAFLAVYLYRMLDNDGTVLVCKPEEGFLFRLINIFL